MAVRNFDERILLIVVNHRVFRHRQKEGFRKIPVTVGLSNGSVTEVQSGVKEGDQVVLQQ